jgi:hypothetical protein
MKLRTLLLVAVLTVLPLHSVACTALTGGNTTTTPLQRVVGAEEVYNATLRQLTTSYQLGLIPESAKASIYESRLLAGAALDTMRVAAKNGDMSGYDVALKAFNTEIDKLIAQRIEADRVRQTRSTTQPAS